MKDLVKENVEIEKFQEQQKVIQEAVRKIQERQGVFEEEQISMKESISENAEKIKHLEITSQEISTHKTQDKALDILVQVQVNCNPLANLSTIKGIVNNVRFRGRCFEAEVFSERLQVPFDFLKTLGIFEYFTENGEATLTIIHLSFLEFATAASLCRPGLDLQRELGNIT